MTVIVRLVRPEEAEAAGRVVVDAFEAIPGSLTDGYAHELADVAGRLAVSEVFVAIDEGAVIGCTTLVTDRRSPLAEHVREGECQIRMMAVAPAHQGRGVGWQLLGTVLERARGAGGEAEGFAAVFLHSTTKMTAAHHLYERNGFVRVPERDWLLGPGFTLLAFRLDLTSGR